MANFTSQGGIHRTVPLVEQSCVGEGMCAPWVAIRGPGAVDHGSQQEKKQKTWTKKKKHSSAYASPFGTG